MDKLLEKALTEFRKKYVVESSDIQSFIFGWRAAIKYINENKIKIKIK